MPTEHSLTHVFKINNTSSLFLLEGVRVYSIHIHSEHESSLAVLRDWSILLKILTFPFRRALPTPFWGWIPFLVYPSISNVLWPLNVFLSPTLLHQLWKSYAESTTHCAKRGTARNKENNFWKFRAIFRAKEITEGTLPVRLLKRLGNKLFPFPSFLLGFHTSSQTLKDRFGSPWNLNTPVWSQEKQTTVC